MGTALTSVTPLVVSNFNSVVPTKQSIRFKVSKLDGDDDTSTKEDDPSVVHGDHAVTSQRNGETVHCLPHSILPNLTTSIMR